MKKPACAFKQDVLELATLRYRKSSFLCYTMSSTDLPKLLRTSVNSVHKCYLCSGFTEVLNDFDNHGFMPNSHKSLELYLIHTLYQRVCVTVTYLMQSLLGFIFIKTCLPWIPYYKHCSYLTTCWEKWNIPYNLKD